MGHLSKIAYLTGEYPRATDTFIQREVAALRAHGHEVLTCSIRQTGVEHLVGDEQRVEAGEHLGCRLAVLAIEREHRDPQARVLETLPLDHVVLRGAGEAVLWAKQRAELEQAVGGSGLEHLERRAQTGVDRSRGSVRAVSKSGR